LAQVVPDSRRACTGLKPHPWQHPNYLWALQKTGLSTAQGGLYYYHYVLMNTYME